MVSIVLELLSDKNPNIKGLVNAILDYLNDTLQGVTNWTLSKVFEPSLSQKEQTQFLQEVLSKSRKV